MSYIRWSTLLPRKKNSTIYAWEDETHINIETASDGTALVENGLGKSLSDDNIKLRLTPDEMEHMCINYLLTIGYKFKKKKS